MTQFILALVAEDAVHVGELLPQRVVQRHAAPRRTPMPARRRLGSNNTTSPALIPQSHPSFVALLKCQKKVIVLVEKNVYKLNSPAPIFSSTGQLLARQNNLEFPTAPRGGCCHSRHDTKGEYFLDPKVKVEIEMKRRYTAQLRREESREMILFPPETSPAGAAIRTCHGSCMRHPPELGFHIIGLELYGGTPGDFSCGGRRQY